VEVKHVVGPFAAILVATIAILFAYTFVDPPVWVRDPLGNSDSTFGRCEPSTWFQVVLDLLLFVTVAISAQQAWQTRKLPEDISDAKRVWHTLAAHLAILIGKHNVAREIYDPLMERGSNKFYGSWPCFHSCFEFGRERDFSISFRAPY
jgi:hypothetical protein